MKLSDNLKIIRKENNLSQEQFAEKLGVSRQAVSKWESGQSFPEMDKVLLICKLFNYNINELMNENVKEVDESKQSKININKYIEDFFSFITRTVDMLSIMRLREKLKCLVEQFIVGSILALILIIIGGIGSYIISCLFGGLNYTIYNAIRNILESIYLVLALILGITILLHIFKIRYLDYYEIIKEDNTENNDTESHENTTDNERNKIVLEKKKEKIIIRDPEHSQSKFLSGIIRIIIWSIKFMAACLAVTSAFSFIGFVVALVLSFMFIKTGLVFIGALLGIIAALAIHFVILEILFNFIISKKNNKHRIAIILIISLVLVGISIGSILIGITKFNYVEDISDNNVVEDTYELQITDNCIVNNTYYSNLEYIETDSDTVKIVVKHSKYFRFDLINRNNATYIRCMNDKTKSIEMIRCIINDINNKEIRNYENYKIYVYASNDNIEKMKENELKIYSK